MTPELLNFLRTKFLLRQVPWIAEADLLLSDLCDEIGGDMYAIKLPERNYLLHKMEETFGRQRMAEVANVLLSYVHRVAQKEGTLPPDELQAERWAAMAYIDSTRDQVVNELVAAFWECLTVEENGAVKSVNWAEMRRLLTIVEEITPQLSAYPELLEYAELTGRIIADQFGEDTLAMLRADLLAQELFVNGRALPRLDSLITRKRYQSITAAAIVHNESWNIIEDAFFRGTPVKGQVVGNNEDGLLVDVGGILTFLPAAHIDIRPVSNLSAFRNHDVEALVLEARLDKARVILSRRALIVETEKVAFDKALEHLQVGMTVEGTVVKITQYGAFVNFGGEIDGLLHISEMSWGYVPDPGSLFKLDDRVEALVIKLDRETRSILLSYKQLIPNPWLTVEERYSRGMQVKGTVVLIGEIWMFVELEPHVVGRVGLWEFSRPGEPTDPKLSPLPDMGDQIDLWVVHVSAERARMTLSTKEQLDEATVLDIESASEWDEVENAFENGLTVKARVLERVKGGLRAEINGIKAFLPNSHVDVRPVRDLTQFIDTEIEAKIIRVNRNRRNVLISRKLVVEEEQTGKKAQTLQGLEAGVVVKGEIKNVTDYGAFVDLGGVDGLLHASDMSWAKYQHPGELFKVGDTIPVKVLKIDHERQRVALGYKQLLPDPWSIVEERFPVGTRLQRRVTRVVDYGAFVELEPGVEGLVHVSEMTWAKRVKHPSKVVNVGDMVEVVVLSVSYTERRVSLGMKQVMVNPWETVADRYQVGMRVHGRVRNLTTFGAFIEIEEGIDGMVHVSDISWTRRIKHPGELLKKGQEVEALIISIDSDNRRLALSLKELEPNGWESFVAEHKVGDVVRGKVVRFADFGAFIELDQNLEGLCHRSELSEDPGAKPADLLELGQELDFKILRIDVEDKKIGLSLKAVGKDEPDEATLSGPSDAEPDFATKESEPDQLSEPEEIE